MATGTYAYTLEPYKGIGTRYNCPQCSKGKTFTRYIDTETGTYIADHVGKCNRAINCGYHYTPKQYFQETNTSFSPSKPHLFNKTRPTFTPQPIKSISFISTEIFKKSLQIDLEIDKITETNHFIKYLVDLFGNGITCGLISKYYIGTSNHWNGATVFWQVDINGKVRTGKIMLYNPATGKRIKKPFNHIHWMHSILPQPDFVLGQCFFGEHLLLRERMKTVAIVESEKTAIIASVYFPEFVWLASGSINNIKAEKCHVLKGRSVVLFPDIKGYDKWNLKAKEFGFQISDLLEQRATDVDRQQGLDLADYLIRFNFKKLRNSGNNVSSTPLSIGDNDIEAMTCLFNYDYYSVQTIHTKDGKYVDILFNKDGNLLSTGTTFEGFKIGTFYGQPALMANTLDLPKPTIAN